MLRYVALLLLVGSGAQAGVDADRYAVAIATLDVSRPESVCKARDALKAVLPNASDDDRRAMFRKFRRLLAATEFSSYNTLSNALEPVLKGFWATNSTDDPTIRRTVAPWLDCGFRISETEGFPVLRESAEAFTPLLPLLPADLEAWVRFEKGEGGPEAGLLGDAALTISWRQLAERLQRFENFYNAYPRLGEEIGFEIHLMAWVLLTGVDNTPVVFDRRTMKVNPETLAAWRWFASGNQPSRYRATVQKVLTLIGADQGLTPEAQHLSDWVAAEYESDVKARFTAMKSP